MSAGRHGVLVKSAVVMERIGQADAVALDKTDTDPSKAARATHVRPLPESGLDEDALLTLAAAAERPSEHPLALGRSSTRPASAASTCPTRRTSPPRRAWV
ncbi:hypothetical protein SPURM210S_07641 [Streptomyces purpurascens]